MSKGPSNSGNRPALVVVDVQVGVMAEGWEAARVISNVALAVRRAREQDVPVVWVQHESDELTRDSAAWQWVPELVPANGEDRIHKRYESSFEATDLQDVLTRLGATHIVLAGAQTNWCIRATAYGALDRGYSLTLLRDAHTTNDIDLGEGERIAAQGIVAELNIAMKWLSYPGRTCGTAAAAEIDFSIPAGTDAR
ncbi:MAG: isochorismatase family protein [Pseudomonadota bacterium]